LNIELLTLSQLQGLTGEAGRFVATLRRQPRYIDLERCTGCGDCAEVCPVTMPSEFEEGLGHRKATFRPYAQAIPGAYLIDKRDRSPCTHACPNHVNAHAYVSLIAQGKYQEAMEVILRTLPFPGTIGRICPHPCETVCRRGEVDAPISICALKRFVADQVDIEELPVPEIEKRDEKVAIIGSGPSGLTAAHFLALEGFQCTVFEAQSVSGGMLRVGIPDYRLPPEVLDKEIRAITRLGVEIKLNTALGRDVTVDGLFSDGYKAVYLAIGAHNNLTLGIPGEDAEGVLSGVAFLRQLNLGELTRVTGRVIIVGGGDVAIDAARSALRLGADEVSIIYRRTRAEMPAREEEVEAALVEGVKIQYLTAPTQVLLRDGRAIGIECLRMQLGEPDPSGRRRPVPVSGSEFSLETDLVIPAIGQQPDVSGLVDVDGLELTRWNTIVVDPVTYATNKEGVFAGGDVEVGPWIAIAAIASGREAAISISRYLQGEDLRQGREPLEISREDFVPVAENIQRVPRAEQAHLSMSERTAGFAEVELGFTEEQARAEAEKCLNCMACCECFECVAACKAEAVTHQMEPETVDIHVGALILAPGFETFDPRKYDEYGYSQFDNVVTSLEFERMLSASGPFQGHLVRPSDHREPKKIAWLQCVGSRDINHCDNSYCSGVCCMHAIKQAVIAKEHAKNGLEASIFFMDMRTFGKDFDKYYNRARDEHGVHFIRSRVHSVIQEPDTGDMTLSYTDEAGDNREEQFDLVVLSVGLQTPAEVTELAKLLTIDLDSDRFCTTTSFQPVATSRAGVFVCGAFQGPKDIPQSVVEASGAASAAGSILASARNSLTTTKKAPPEINIAGEPPRVGVFVCHCGINIAGVVDVEAVRDYASTLPYVVYVEDNLYSCSQDTQAKMLQVIKEQRLNRVVVAACSPRTHEPLFQDTLTDSGLNKYLFEMANIRNHDSWVHGNTPETATAKAKDLLRMAVAKVALLEPLPEASVEIKQSALVVGGGVAGMVAALQFAEQGYPVTLLEASSELGGHARHIRSTWQGEDVRTYLTGLVAEVEAHSRIRVHLNSQISKVKGFVGNFQSKIQIGGDKGLKYATFQHGVAVIAVGGQAIVPDEYLYGRHPGVLRWHELEDGLEAGKFANAKCAVFIQCVGSREPQRPYCSRICCTFSIQQAVALKEANPEMDVYVLYRDIRTYGQREALYRQARDAGVVFIRYSVEQKPTVETDSSGRLRVSVIDHVLQRPLLISPDIITLATAIETSGADKLAQLFKVPLNDDMFFMEAHAKLRPVECATDGVFICGLAHYPKAIDECVAQAQAAASRAITVLAQESLHVSGQVATVNPWKCSACGVCVTICPYSAPEFNDRGISEINPALCKGCGLCVASCRSGAIDLKGFEDKQIFAMIEEL
jgi:heterodisulfide reductase subunit A-like polyferredoxin